MININFDDFNKLNFELTKANPIVKRFGFSPIVADPSVLTPSQSHDGKWHMFCHTLFGVYHFISSDGFSWKKRGKVLNRAMRPNINYIDGVYYLYYESVQPLLKRGLSLINGKWKSEIYVTTSADLINWSKPLKVVGAEKDYMLFNGGYSVSNPFLIKNENNLRLYFSAGLTYIKDCGFSEPTYISLSESDNPLSGFTPLDCPILKPDSECEYLNICCGCIKVYRLKDCFIGLQNGIYKDKDNNSHSAIMLLKSNDGINFEFVKPLIVPKVCPESKIKDWMAQYVYACCLSCFDGTFYIYFNARDKAHALKGRENIGLAIATIEKAKN